MSVPAAVKTQIQHVGGAFMFSREAKAYAASTGVENFLGPYTRGRGGVLGDVDADVVTAAFGFFEPRTVRAAWESVRLPAAAATAAYREVIQQFGRRKLAGFEQAGRLAELLEAVARAADVTGVPLFAGWRAQPLPADAPARALQLMHVLRELRGGHHLLAVTAAGLTPLQAVLIAGSPFNDGPTQARLFGWPEPYEQPTPEIRQRWEHAEQRTDALVAPAFAVLDEREGKELVELVHAAHATVFPPR
ncbi:hypothetical protein NDR87_00905 [Nocardia sp. CDC159]|uniref:EvbL n=1 Tax=Nocardia pulmonis TaxID=2951408 RepID=A0A9X2E3J9_9NOCA|nr:MULTISPECIES: hypothetical protein [Nocardia]MCM6772428.1 hypothetical protein [Nocardia pulmonis]MCM6784914.1 hypothetical protein [Nocardia sp. CDC159]